VRGIVTVILVAALVAGCGRGQSAANREALDLPADPAVVHTSYGALRGTVADDHRYFAGIPYAAPPLGEGRWRSPAPPPRWSGMRDATRPGPRCVQDVNHDVDRRPTSEDCLTLNVWTPPPSQQPRAVLVWFHGGGFLNGSSDFYNARRLVGRGDILVVTVNYRLSSLGFLAHPAFGPDSGNYGLADQQAALRWVRDNIAGFGGDPDRVTIAGESAGGMSVCDHLVAPGSAGLFAGAIIQSAPCTSHYDLPAAQRISERYAADVGCPDPQQAQACLRALPAEKLAAPLVYDHLGTEPLSGPVTGTPSLPSDPVTAMAQVRVPVLIGTTGDEFKLFAALQLMNGKPIDAARYPALLDEAFGPSARAVADQYRPEQFGGDVALTYAAAMTDGDFACVADDIADTLTSPVYAYEFNDHRAPAPEMFDDAPFPIGASHSLELRYLFDVGGAPPLNPAQLRLSEQMIDYWSQFVRTGSPNAPGLPLWPAVDAVAAGPRMSLQPGGSRVITDYEQKHRCAFWAGLRG